jgi:hypothetical protein
MRIAEIQNSAPTSAGALILGNLKAQAKCAKAAEKTERAKQQIKKAQQDLRQVAGF